MQVRIPRLVPIGGVVQRQAHLSVTQETRVRSPSSPPITTSVCEPLVAVPRSGARTSQARE